VGRLDRGVALLTAGPPGNADNWLAVAELLDGELAAPVRAQLWGLLDALPAGPGKAELAGGLAARFAAAGEHANAARLTAEALAALATAAARRESEWELTLVAVAGRVPDAERAGNLEQQRWLREMLAAVRAPAAPAKQPR
jgi:hypothetical protein